MDESALYYPYRLELIIITVNFADVTDIKIPNGEVLKIHETSSGRVIWQKVENGYPQMFIRVVTTSGKTYYSNFWRESGNFIEFTGYPNGTDFQFWSLHNGPNPYAVGGLPAYPIPSIGDTYTAFYVNNSNEKNNFTTKAHLVNDAKWYFFNTDAYLGRGGGTGLPIPSLSNHLIIFNPTTGSTVKIQSILNDSQCKALIGTVPSAYSYALLTSYLAVSSSALKFTNTISIASTGVFIYDTWMSIP